MTIVENPTFTPTPENPLRLGLPHEQIPVPQVLGEYLVSETFDKGKSQFTKKLYGQDLARFALFLQRSGIQDTCQLNEETIPVYVDYMRSRGNSDKTIYRNIVSIRGFIGWAANEGILPIETSYMIPKISVGPLKEGKVVKLDKVQADLVQQKALEMGSRAGALVGLMSQGIEVHDVISIRTGDIKFWPETRTVDVLVRSSDNPRTITFANPGLYNAFRELTVQAKKGYIFPSPGVHTYSDHITRQAAWLVVSRLGDRVGINRLNCKTLICSNSDMDFSPRSTQSLGS